VQFKLVDTLNALATKKTLKYALYFFAVIIFLGIILLPPIVGIFTKWSTIQTVLAQPKLMNQALGAITNSFTIGLIVAAIDLVAGIPMAWLITRGKSKWLNVLDTFADIPFIVPTAALGYSLYLFWDQGTSALFGAPLVSPGWILVMLLHFTFSFPVVVRVIVGSLLDYKLEYERASRTLGAPPFTAARTVTFPIIKPSLIAAYTLAFARSLSETGATFIVAGSFENGPVFLQNLKNAYTSGTIPQSTYQGATVFASLILIVVSLTIFALIRILAPKVKIPLGGGLPKAEKKLSYSKPSFARNTITILVFTFIILIPSLYVAFPAFQAIFTKTLIYALTGAGVWTTYWQGLLVSYGLATIVTVIGFAIGLPMAILIARKKFGRLPSLILDTLVNVPIIVPSIALGVSLTFFWQGITGLPEFVLLIFAHLAITYPYMVKSISAALERINPDMEDAAKTLGAKPFTVFRTIVLPLTKYSMLSGAIMVFARSVSETGATLAVSSKIPTAPVVLVNWVKGVVPATPMEIGLGAGILILLSFIILLTLRFITGEKGKY
jgi:thiamine transport system permease protein